MNLAKVFLQSLENFVYQFLLQERDDCLMQAEREKQEEMRQMEKEKAMLVDMIKEKDEEIDDLSIALEKLKKDSSSKIAQDKVDNIFKVVDRIDVLVTFER